MLRPTLYLEQVHHIENTWHGVRTALDFFARLSPSLPAAQATAEEKWGDVCHAASKKHPAPDQQPKSAATHELVDAPHALQVEDPGHVFTETTGGAREGPPDGVHGAADCAGLGDQNERKQGQTEARDQLRSKDDVEARGVRGRGFRKSPYNFRSD